MNILPHKSWHVRTKANIARVRKDEAKAAEEEKERQRRIELAESEARTAHLREKAKEKFNRHNTQDKKQDDTTIADEDKPIAYPPHEHVNLFRDVEEGTDGFKKTNEDREKEDKETREKYEKSIGYLTYLGQDTQVTSWYQGKRIRDEIDTINACKEVVGDDEESQLKDKLRHDPLTLIQTAVGVQKTSKEITSQTTSVDYCISKQNSKESEKKQRRVDRKNKEDSKDSEKRKRSVDRKERGKKRKRNDSCSASSGSSSYSYKRRKSHHKKHKHKNSSKRQKRREQKLIKSSSESDSDEEEKKKQLLKLREERLKREREEKARAEKLLAKLRGEKIPDETAGEEKGENRRRQKYNSQYNPDIAKQNKD